MRHLLLFTVRTLSRKQKPAQSYQLTVNKVSTVFCLEHFDHFNPDLMSLMNMSRDIFYSNATHSK